MGGVTGAGSREAEEGHGGLCRQLGLAGGAVGWGPCFQSPTRVRGLCLSPSAAARLLWLSVGVSQEQWECGRQRKHTREAVLEAAWNSLSLHPLGRATGKLLSLRLGKERPDG